MSIDAFSMKPETKADLLKRCCHFILNIIQYSFAKANLLSTLQPVIQRLLPLHRKKGIQCQWWDETCISHHSLNDTHGLAPTYPVGKEVEGMGFLDRKGAWHPLSSTTSTYPMAPHLGFPVGGGNTWKRNGAEWQSFQASGSILKHHFYTPLSSCLHIKHLIFSFCSTSNP